MARRRVVVACLHVLVVAALAQRANAQASWHPRNFLRGDRVSGGEGGETSSGTFAVDPERAVDDAPKQLEPEPEEPTSVVPDEPEQEGGEGGGGGGEEVATSTGMIAPQTTPAEQKSCGCLAGVNDYHLNPASDFWTTTPLPETSPTLEAALEAASSSNKVTLVMMTNEGEMDLVDNFLCSLRMFGVNKYLIFATDTGALAMMKERGYHVWDGRSIVGKGLDKNDSNFRSSGWKHLVRAKMKVAEQVLRAGFHLFFSDVDVVALENFLPSLVADDKKSPQWLVDWDGKKGSTKEANTGFYFMRAEQESIDLLTKATLQQKKMPAKDDQQLINAVMPARLRNFMPRPRFANGCYLRNVGKGSDLRKNGVAAVHVNCAVSKLMKHKLMCNMGLWFCANTPEGGNPKGKDGKCKPGYGMAEFRNSSAALAAAV
jgi:hypothetical protein